MKPNTERIIQTKSYGTIRLKNEVIVTDPCYDTDEWCNITVRNVLPGNYNIFVRNAAKKDYYDGPSRVILVHEDYMDNFIDGNTDLIFDNDPASLKQTELAQKYYETPIGVDSGLAGFFNYDYYRKAHSGTKEKQDKWFERICEIKEKPCKKIGQNGFYTTNWLGDGGYNLYTFLDSADTKDEITVGFILDYRLEEF